MPVANLQTYRSVALRVHTTAFAAQGQAMFLETAVLDNLRQKCGFEAVGRSGEGGPADVVLDLNIIATGRGGGGWVTNDNLATVDTLLVLTDGQDGQLLGTAKIHGKSSGMIVNGAPPEKEAIGVVAKTIADILAKSGCSGPRVARAVVPPPGTGSGAGSATGPVVGEGTGSNGGGGPPPADEAHRPQAEALNDQGKEKLYAADMAGALGLFQQANALLPDAKYEFNICIALGAQEQWDNAMAACKHARSMNPPATLATKIDHRIDLLQHRQ